MEKIVSQCLVPDCKTFYKCNLEKECPEKIVGEDGKCTIYEICAEKEEAKISHGYCDEKCMEKALTDLKVQFKKE